ncbi:hypothetical protein [Gimesia sp.]|uniref:hypothetical protein n=1 Tax=Gimesia sp. TaxID=2024833 RepID=UPI0025C2707D|nr:hypothetical protein [Gimesia sp.]|tara:strand:- start:48985 stop:49140 length:156 start_codon:yes stop_codon:yes gene_type:complete
MKVPLFWEGIQKVAGAKKSPFSKLPEIENGENAFDSREESGIRAKKTFHGI